jgi:hypothetical protein
MRAQPYNCKEQKKKNAQRMEKGDELEKGA